MNEHTLDQLRSLRLDGMVRAVEEQATSTTATALGFDERFSLLVQSEVAWHTYLDNPTLADAILDRVMHSSHRIDLKGATLRDKKKEK